VGRAAGRVDETANALDRACRAETDQTRRAELAADLGELYESLGDAPRAVAAYEQARADEPESPRALSALHRLYRETEQWQELAEVIPDVVGMAERAQVVELQVELGDVLSERLARHDQAVAAYTAALALDPKHPSAFQGLAAVYQATGQTDALLDASEAEADAADPSARARRYGEIAEDWRGRGRFDRAAALWQKAVDLAPKDPAARRGLATALRGNEQWGSLASELRALLEIVNAPGERLAVLLELGDVATQLDDQDGAVTAYQSALAIEADHMGALDALARLYERGEKTASAIVVLQRLLEHATDPRARASLFQRLGAAQLDARDVPAARLAFEQALALDLASAAAHEGIARVHLLEDRAVAGGDELVRAAELAPSPQDQIRCLVDAAWVFRHRVHDAERARQCLRLVLELEPAHADAKQLLAELLQDTQQWESLWPHLQEEVQHARINEQLPPAQRAEIYARAARCAVELDLTGQALELYDLALAADATPDLHLERADALYRSKALDAAAPAYQSIVLRHAATLGKDRLVAVYRRLAEIHAALGKPMQAQLFHQKVLELDPHHKPTLTELAELHVARGRYDESIAQLRTLAKLAEPAERVRLLERIGDLYRDRLKNAPRAMSTFLEALELDDTNRRILQRVLDLQTAAGQWKAAVETIGKFLEHETDPARRAAYHLAAAEIRRNELKDKVGALDGYETALDELCAAPSPDTTLRALETFRLIDEMVTADKNWKYQEQAYRRMIRRVPDGAPALVQLWDALGEVYRSRLKSYQSAIEAFETAHALDPTRAPDRTAKLTELYALVGRKQPRAVVQRAAKLVAADPFQPESYRALGRASAEAGRIDEAWCAARALVFLKQATADETALYKRFRTHEARKATGAFDEASWAHVRHPDEDRAISAIFSVVWQAPVALRAGPAKAFDLRPKERLPIEDGTRVIAKIFRHAARVLGVALPDVYVQPHRSGRLLLANCIDRGRLVPAVIVGRDLMTGYRDTELAAAVGAMLALLRPAYYLTLALANLDELEATLGAACEIGGRPGIGDPEGRAQLAAEMQKRVPRRALESLAQLVAHLPEKPDVARWRACVDAAAQRAGLLVGGELAAAARMLSTDAASPGGAQRVRHLVAYSVSPAHFEARRHLGVNVA
jgi:tetratricopeptide (TPR) repeat protein